LANHPDKVPESEREQAHIRFQQAQGAYEILKDPETRAVYDESGLEGVKNGPGGGFPSDADFTDFLSHMFGHAAEGFAGGMGGMGGGRKSRDAVQKFEVSLEDLYKGKQVKMMSKRKVVCTTCKG
jgi:DnaJ homolog subfamily A member 2